MWEVKALRDLAIRNLNQLDVVDMLLLGSEYHVSQWFITGCTRLIMRNQGPTEEEGHLLGIGFIVKKFMDSVNACCQLVSGQESLTVSALCGKHFQTRYPTINLISFHCNQRH